MSGEVLLGGRDERWDGFEPLNDRDVVGGPEVVGNKRSESLDGGGVIDEVKTANSKRGEPSSNRDVADGLESANDKRDYIRRITEDYLGPHTRRASDLSRRENDKNNKNIVTKSVVGEDTVNRKPEIPLADKRLEQTKRIERDFYVCRIEDFSSVRVSEREQQQMREDNEWANAKKVIFDGDQKYQASKQIAHNLERFVGTRFVRKNWFEQDLGEPQFDVVSLWPDKYDDYSHRIDTMFSFVDRGEPLQKLTIGLDVTTNGNEAVIMDKLTRSYSDPKLMTMFGFSQVSYCKDCNGDPIRSPVLVPRYVLATAATDVSKLKSGGMLAHSRGKMTEKQIKQAQQEYPNLMQLKFLMEMQVQNNLYVKMLPQEEDFNVKLARRHLKYMRNRLNTAIYGCTERIIRNGYFQSVFPQMAGLQSVPQNDKRADSYRKLRQLYLKGCIEDNLAKRWPDSRLTPEARGYKKQALSEIEVGRGFDADFEQEWRRYANILLNSLLNETQRQWLLSEPNGTNGKEPSVQLIETARKLTKAAEQGRLNRFKGLLQHNRGIVLDKTTQRYQYATAKDRME